MLIAVHIKKALVVSQTLPKCPFPLITAFPSLQIQPPSCFCTVIMFFIIDYFSIFHFYYFAVIENEPSFMHPKQVVYHGIYLQSSL